MRPVPGVRSGGALPGPNRLLRKGDDPRDAGVIHPTVEEYLLRKYFSK
jgi:hypothetical protein